MLATNQEKNERKQVSIFDMYVYNLIIYCYILSIIKTLL